MNFIKILIITVGCFFVLSSEFIVRGEGTKETQPKESNSNFLRINGRSGSNTGNNFSYSAASDLEKLYIHIKDFTNERVHFGFQARFNNSYYVRIKDPTGAVVFASTLIPNQKGTGYIENYAQAVAGPRAVNPAGYDGFSFDPTSNGEYVIEFNAFDQINPNNIFFDLRYYDITVATKSANPQAIPGRLFAYAWAFNTASFSTETEATFYAYTADSVVTTLQLNGLRPYIYGVYCNRTGGLSTGDVQNDRKSLNYRPQPLPSYRLFLNNPDEEDFPSATFPTLTSPPTISGCPTEGYCIELSINKVSDAEVLLDFNNNGVFDEGTVDVKLNSKLNRGTSCIPWDGFDGLGNRVADGTVVTGYALAIAGLTNFPIWDAEVNNRGVKVAIVRPQASPPLVFWDDTNLGRFGTKNLTGSNSPAHTWSRAIGNSNLINTWWYTFSINEKFIYSVQNQCPPIANPDIVNGCVDVPVTFNPLTNDTDTENNISVASLGVEVPPNNGTIKVNRDANGIVDGTFTYTPNPRFIGKDSFRYGISDFTPLRSSLAEDRGLVSINIGPSFTLTPKGVCGLATDGTISFDVLGDNFTYGFVKGNSFGTGTTNLTAINGTNTITNLGAGNYTVRLDNGLCTEDKTVTIRDDQGPPFTLRYDPFCAGSLTNIYVETTIPGLRYNFSQGSTYNNSENPPTSFATVNGLNVIRNQTGDRIYTVRLIDPNTGCFTDRTIDTQSSAGTLPAVTNITTTTSCRGNDGAFTFQSTPGFTYAYSTGDTYSGPADPGVGSNVNTIPTSGNVTISNLTSGTYTLRVKNNNTVCYFDTSILITDSTPSFSLRKRDICNGASTTGSIFIDISGTIYNYGITSGRVYDTTIPVNNTLTNGRTTLNNQATGVYTIRVQNTQTNCFSDQSIKIEAVENVILSLDKKDECGNNSNGEISFIAEAPGLSYGWNSGSSYTGPIPPINGITNDDLNIIPNLSQGDYAVLLYDPNSGCFAEESITVDRANSLSLSLSQTASICNDGTISFTDQTPGLTYDFSEGGVYYGDPVPTLLPSANGATTINNLADGTYTVRLYNTASGCFIDQSIDVPKTSNCPPITVDDLYGTFEEVTVTIPTITVNDSDRDGAIDISTIDLDVGTTGLQNNISTPEGNWTADAAGNVTFIPIKDYNGTAVLPYTVNDNDGQTSPPAYIRVTVTPINDQPTFIKGSDITVGENAGSQIFTGWATSINKGATNEARQVLTFTVTNDDNTLFQIQPSIDPTTGDLTFVPTSSGAGTATVTVVLTDSGGTDDGGIDTFTTQNFTITVSPKPTISLNAKTNASTCGGDGSIILDFTNVPDGLYTLNYLDAANAGQTFANVQITNGTTTITNAKKGTYNDFTITVNGSISTDNVDVIITEPPAPIIAVSSDDTDNLLSNGQIITFTATGGVSYDFLVNNASVQKGTNDTYSSGILNDGDVISVVGTDANNCMATSNNITVSIDAINPPAPTAVSIKEDANNDGLINKTEVDADADNNLTVIVEIPMTGIVAGDRVVVNGTSKVITIADIGKTVSFDFPKPAEGGTFTASATIFDIAGNESDPPVLDTASLDTTKPNAPTVVITDDANNDGFINQSEKNSPISVRIDLPADAIAGDILSFNGSVLRTLTNADIINKNVTTTLVDPTPPNTGVSATAFLTDIAGNIGDSATDTAIIDNTAPSAPIITFTQDADNNDILGETENNGVDVAFSVDLLGDIVAGDQFTYNGTTYTILGTDITAGMLSFTIPNPGDGNDAVVMANFTDGVGNVGSTTTERIKIDTTPPAAPTVEITEDADNNGLLGSTEISGDIDVVITLPQGTVANQLISINGATERPVTTTELTTGISLQLPVPAEGVTLKVTATLKDLGGNPSLVGSDEATVDRTPNAAPTVEITEDTDDNGLIGASEDIGPVDITITLPATAVAGEILVVTSTLDGANPITRNINLTAADILSGSVTTTILNQPDNVVIVTTASITDLAGNPGAEGTDTATIDLNALAAPVITITEDANSDGYIGISELVGDVDISIALPTGTQANDVLTVDGKTITITTTQATAGVVTTTVSKTGEGLQTYTAFVTNAAGNKGDDGTKDIIFDTVAPLVPTAIITEDANDDGFINGTESNGAIDVSITLPVGTEVGDILTVNGVDKVLDASDIAGTAEVKTTILAPVSPNTTVTLTASVTDKAGNKGPEATDTAIIDNTAPSAPIITFTQDADNNDILGETENNGVDVAFSVALPGDIVAGDQFTYNGTTYTILGTDITAGMLSFTIPNPGDGNEAVVMANFTDGVGNVGSTTTERIKIDTTPPAAPTVEITEDADNNGLLGSTEISGDIDVVITLPQGTVANQLISINGAAERPVTTTELTTGISLQLPVPAEGVTLKVTATLKDLGGNPSLVGSDEATVDRTPNAAPTVEITEDTDDNGLIGASEDIGPVDITITLPATAVAGEILVVTSTLDGANPITRNINLTATDILSGSVTTTILNQPNNVVIVTTASITDLAGNPGAEGTDTATIDLNALAAPVITITEDANSDGYIGISELVGDVDISIALPTGTQANDVLTVDGKTITITTTQATAGVVTTTVSKTGEGLQTYTAFVTNAAGNKGDDGTKDIIFDTVAPLVPTAIITEDANDDGFINGTESNGAIDVSITLPAGTEVGDILTVNGVDKVLDASDIAGTAEVKTTILAPVSPNTTVTLTASVTDKAGNKGPEATDTATIDNTAPSAPIITFTQDADNNDILGGTENNGVDVAFSVALPGDIVAGDQFTYNGTTYTILGTDITAGSISFTIPNPGDGNEAVVMANFTDRVGNVGSTTTERIKIDTTPPAAPTVEITEDADNNGLLGSTEISGDIDVVITLPQGTVANQLISINGAAERPVTTTELTTGISLQLPVPAEGVTLKVTATLKDLGGNPSLVGSDEATVDRTPNGAPTVEITEDTDDNGLIGASEDIGPVDITITLPATAVAGEILVVTSTLDGANPITRNINLTAADILSGSVTTTILNQPNNVVIVTTASVTDLAGNPGAEGTDTATIDLNALAAPVITITEDANSDGYIGISELVGDVDVSIALPTGTQANDVLTVDGKTITITTTQATAGVVTTTVSKTGEGLQTYTAFVTNAAGNKGDDGTKDIIFDMVAPLVPTAIITEDANDDGFINGTESNGAIDVSITLPAGTEVGDILTVNGVDKVLDASDIAGTVVMTTIAAPVSPNTTVTLTASVTDKAGNKGPEATDTATIDNTAPSAPTITFTQDADNNDILGETENNGVDVAFSVALPGDIVAGDQFTYNGTTYTILGTDITAGMLSFTISNPGDGNDAVVMTNFTDRVGNVGSTTTERIKIDTTPPAAPTVEITEDADNNGLLGSTEISGDIDVVITLPQGTVANQLISINGATERPVTTTELTTGISLQLPVPAEGVTLKVTATLKDLGGNPSLVGSDEATVDRTPNGAPTVEITEDTDDNGLIGASEDIGPVDITITLPATAVAGETLVVTSTLDGANPITRNINLTATDILSGSVTTTILNQPNNVVIVTTASITDLAGNPGAEGTDTATIDLNALAAPVITITEDANSDGYIGISELVGDVDISIALPTGTQANDVLTVDGKTITITTTQATAGVVTTTVSKTGEGLQTYTAFVTNAAGNKGDDGTKDIIFDTVAPLVPTAIITEDANDDGFINGTESNGAIDVSITLPAGTEVGDILTVNGVDKVLDASDIAGTAEVKTTILAPVSPNTTVTLTASVTDKAGNKGTEATDTAIIDNTAPSAPIITFTQDADNNDILGGTENNGVDVAFSVALPGDIVAGDQFTYNGTTYTILGTDITAGMLSFTIPNPGDGNDAVVMANFTDGVGNVGSTTTERIKIDTTPPAAPTVEITEDADNNGLLGSTEISGDIDVVITLPQGTVANQLISINGAAERPVTTTELTTGISLQLPVPAEGVTLKVTATLKDLGGNPSLVGSDEATVDRTPNGAPTVEITEDTDDNGLIGASEDIGPVDITITLPATAVAGETLVVTSTLDGASPITRNVTLTAADILSGSVTTTILNQPNNVVIVTTASVTDLASNPGAEGTDAATIDLNALAAPVITITEDANSDGYIGISELVGDVDVSIALPTGTQANDVLTVDGKTITITTTQATVGVVTTTVSKTGEGLQTYTAFVTNAAGNKGDDGTKDIIFDTVAPLVPTAIITEDANDDGFINGTESNGAIDVSITLPVGTEVGDILTVNGVDKVLDASDIAGTVVMTTIAAPVSPNTSVTLTASVTDKAGNKGPEATDTATIDNTAPSAPTITFTQDADNNDILGETENNGVDVAFSVALPGDIVAGDQFTYNGTTYTILGTDITAGMLSFTISNPGDGNDAVVMANFTDRVGNVGSTTTERIKIDTTPPAAPTVEITEDADNNGLLGSTEISGDIDVVITLPQGTVANQLISINGATERPVTTTELTTGISLQLPVPAEGVTLKVTATLKDLGGNPSLVGSDEATVELAVLPAPTILFTSDDSPKDSQLSDEESRDGSGLRKDILLLIKLPEKIKVGDVLVVASKNDGIDGSLIEIAITSQNIGISGSRFIVTSLSSQVDGTVIDVEAFIRSGSGNEGMKGTNTITMNYSGPMAPTIIVTEDTDMDGVVLQSELEGDFNVQINLPADAVAGDKLTVNGVVVDITQAHIDAGAIVQTTIPKPDEGDQTITAFVTNSIGNKGTEAVVDINIDTIVPKPPVIIIREDANSDGIITATELNGKINYYILIPNDAKVGDILIINGEEIVLTASNVANGIDRTIDSPEDGKELNFTASIKDFQGNESPQTTIGVLINSAAPEINSGISFFTNPVITGSARAGETIIVDVVIGSAVIKYEVIVDENGQWNIPTETATSISGILPEIKNGDVLNIKAEDKNGAIGTGSITVNISEVDLKIETSILEASPYFVDSEISIQIQVTNISDKGATNAQVNISYSVGVTILNSEELLQDKWDLESLAPGESKTLVLRISLDQVETKTFIFEVTAKEVDPQLDNNQSVLPIDVISGDLQTMVSSVEVPKAFTPNGDLQNNDWIIKGIENFPNNRITVLNRWGNKVYEMKGYNNNDKVWRGIANTNLVLGNGLVVPDGTYFYILELDSSLEPIKGFVMIVK